MITKTGKIQVTIINNATFVTDELDLNTSITLYRVMEELLNNTMKHAQASKIYIGFEASGELLVINYHDNGKGIASTIQHGKGMGMQNIESRLKMIGANFRIDPLSENGFNMHITIKHEPDQNSNS